MLGVVDTWVVGASLSKPHIDCNNGLPHGIMVCMYLFMYHLPHVCRTLVPEIRVRPEMLFVFQYIDLLMCVISTTALLNGKNDWNCSRLPWRLSTKTGRVNAQTHGINRFTLLRQWTYSCLATCQCTWVCESEATDGLTVLLFVTFIST